MSDRSWARVACLSIILLPVALVRAEEPLDFDPALLLDDTPPSEAPYDAAEIEVTAQSTRAEPEEVVQLSGPSAEPSPNEAVIAPLTGDLKRYIASAATVWHITPGETLQAVLARWTQDAGWTLVWRAGKPYQLEAGLSFPEGTEFRDAARAVIGAVWRENQKLIATAYMRNNVLVVEDGFKGD